MIFRKQPDAEPRYTLDDLRRDIGAAIAKARDAHIHSVGRKVFSLRRVLEL